MINPQSLPINPVRHNFPHRASAAFAGHLLIQCPLDFVFRNAQGLRKFHVFVFRPWGFTGDGDSSDIS